MAVKPKGDAAPLQQLKRDLAGGVLGGLYLLHGEEAYLRTYYLEEMKKRLLTPGSETFNLHTLGKEATVAALSEAVDCLPMMSDRTLVLVTDYDLFKAPAADRDGLAALFAQLPDYCCLVFVYDILEYKPDARTKLAAALKTHGQTVAFSRQEQGDLVTWIGRRFRALGHDIDTMDAQYLIFLCGDLMTGLISEIEKIGAYARGKRVTRADIDAVAVPKLDAVVFQMTDHVALGQYDKAAAVLGDLLHMQQPPIMILSVLGKQLRQLYAARLALEHKKDAAWLANLWSMRSQWQAGRLLDSARRYDLDWCRSALVRCGQADLALKSTGADGGAVLTDLLLALAVERGL